MIMTPDAARYGRREHVSPIRMLEARGVRWRVGVETWQGRDGWSGRFVFEPTPPVPANRGMATQEGPVVFRSATLEELVALAYDVPESRLRAVLLSMA
ncbi:MAG: hypothetical protein P8099_05625 [Gemmatimonadota bacterium]|jgi:hypothetical protein